MFSSPDHFGLSCSHSCSPFESQPVIGQTANANNPFAPKPFGSNTSPFGSQTGSLVFGGGTSTGVFGEAQSSAPLNSTTTFCGLSSPTFRSTLSTFGSTLTPAIGSSSSSSFGGSSIFGQKSNGGFGSIPTQTNPFESTNQQSQSSLGSNVFSSPFDSSSHSALGATSNPAFGTAIGTPTIGATNTSTFGATSTPVFGTTSNPVIGVTSTLAFGTTSTPAFGSSSTHAFGSIGNALSTPSFGFRSGGGFDAPSTHGYGVSSPPIIGGCCCCCCCTPAFCRPTLAFRSSTFGSRVALYASTTEPNDVHGSSPSRELQSISAMPDYKYKSLEELRWEDYLLGDKGGRLPAGQSTGGVGFSLPPAQPNLQAMPVISRNPFGSTIAASTSSFPSISSNPSALTTAASTSSFSSISLNHFATNPAVSSNRFASTTSASTFSFPSLAIPEPSGPFSIPSNHGQIQPSRHSTNTCFDGQLGRIAPTTKRYDESAQTVYGGQPGGSRVVLYSSTTRPNDGSSLFENLVLVSITAMPSYEDKSHEELRWEDYQSGDKGGAVPTGQSTGGGGGGGGGIGFCVSTAQPNLQGSTFGLSSSNPFSIVISANPFGPKPSDFGTFGPSMTISFNSSEPAALSIPLNPSFSFQSFNVFFNA